MAVDASSLILRLSDMGEQHACKPEEAAGGVRAARALGTVEEGYCCEWVAFEGILAKVESVLRCV